MRPNNGSLIAAAYNAALRSLALIKISTARSDSVNAFIRGFGQRIAISTQIDCQKLIRKNASDDAVVCCAQFICES